MTYSKAEKRFSDLISIVRKSNIQSQDLLVGKFYWVFGNLIQECIADSIYEEVKDEIDWNASVQKSYEIARDYFGEDSRKDWPFHQEWLKDYIRWRFLGSREGTSREDRRSGGLEEFKERYPISKSTCNWYLGCNSTIELQADHLRAWKLHGPSTPEDYQWLCEKHNNRWKKTLLFWGDNFIPFKDFAREDQPR